MVSRKTAHFFFTRGARPSSAAVRVFWRHPKNTSRLLPITDDDLGLKVPTQNEVGGLVFFLFLQALFFQIPRRTLAPSKDDLFRKALAESGNRSEPAKSYWTTSSSHKPAYILPRSPSWLSPIRTAVGETTLALAVPAA